MLPDTDSPLPPQKCHRRMALSPTSLRTWLIAIFFTAAFLAAFIATTRDPPFSSDDASPGRGRALRPNACQPPHCEGPPQRPAASGVAATRPLESGSPPDPPDVTPEAPPAQSPLETSGAQANAVEASVVTAAPAAEAPTVGADAPATMAVSAAPGGPAPGTAPGALDTGLGAPASVAPAAASVETRASAAPAAGAAAAAAVEAQGPGAPAPQASGRTYRVLFWGMRRPWKSF